MINFRKWNIIVVTLFITLIVWLIGLLVTKYIYQLSDISSENFKYYKAYYIWYAGVELELLKLKNHWLGFEDKVLKTSQTVLRNFTGNNYYFSSEIKSLSKQIANTPLVFIFTWKDFCDNKKNWIKLKTWDAMLFPLFYDKNLSEAPISWKNYTLLNLDFSNVTLYYSWNLLVSLQSKVKNYKKNVFWSSEIDLQSLLWVSSVNNLVEDWASDEPYLIVWALSNSSFCIKSNQKMVNFYSDILSWGSYMNRKVLLNVPKKNKWANFTIYWIY